VKKGAAVDNYDDSKYDFTHRWYKGSNVHNDWPGFIQEWKPLKAMEIGSYEGASACFLLDNAPSLQQLFCIDTWEGSSEHQDVNFIDVEYKFGRNIVDALEDKNPRPTVVRLKGPSHRMMSGLMDKHEGSFDWIYIDGSHRTPDVLLDAMMSLKLLRPGGLMIFDDYTWKPHDDMNTDVERPHMAINTFIETHVREVDVILMKYQVFLRKKPEQE
jgi:predicted O-methyltransferase YrrM